MIANARTTLVQILFPRGTPCDLAAVVMDLDRTLAPCLGLGHRLTWHAADVAIVELGATRVTLVVSALPRDGRAHRTCLSVSVGAVPGLSTDVVPGRRHANLARTVVDAVQARHEADCVIWQKIDEAATPALLRELAGTVPAHPDPVWKVDRIRPMAPAAGDVPTTGEQDLLGRARSAIYVAAEAGPDRASIQLRIAATAMASTIAIVALPVGAALMTYSLFRGADFRLSALVMSLTGTFLAVGGTPAGQNLLAALALAGT